MAVVNKGKQGAGKQAEPQAGQQDSGPAMTTPAVVDVSATTQQPEQREQQDASLTLGATQPNTQPDMQQGIPVLDVSQLTREQLFEAQRRAEALRIAEEEAAKQEAQEQYAESATGLFEERYKTLLPTYQPGTLRYRQQKGGFLQSEFDVLGVPESQMYRWVAESSIYDYSRLWVPVSPGDVTRDYNEFLNARRPLLFFPSFEVRSGRVVYRESVLMLASKTHVVSKESDEQGRWSDNFNQRLPKSGRGFVPVAGKRALEVQGQTSHYAEDLFDSVARRG